MSLMHEFKLFFMRFWSLEKLRLIFSELLDLVIFFLLTFLVIIFLKISFRYSEMRLKSLFVVIFIFKTKSFSFTFFFSKWTFFFGAFKVIFFANLGLACFPDSGRPMQMLDLHSPICTTSEIKLVTATFLWKETFSRTTNQNPNLKFPAHATEEIHELKTWPDFLNKPAYFDIQIRWTGPRSWTGNNRNSSNRPISNASWRVSSPGAWIWWGSLPGQFVRSCSESSRLCHSVKWFSWAKCWSRVPFGLDN